jgi:hypothetical protein
LDSLHLVQTLQILNTILDDRIQPAEINAAVHTLATPE